VTNLSYTALVLWFLGHLDQAVKRVQEGLTLAQELSNPPSLAFARACAAWLHQFRREGQLTQEWAEALLALSTEQGFSDWLAMGTMLRGWALAEQGQPEEGITQLGQGLAAYRATGAEVYRPYWLALLAEAYGKVGQTEEGLTVLAEALAAAHKTGGRHHEAELYRLKGELSLQSRQVEGRSQTSQGKSEVEKEAEECFGQAIEIARRQSAKSFELRAVLSLSRLWQRQGKKDEARQMLAEIYGWFTEGFDTPDLQEAKALLTELS
jgi:predicted ATPase